MHRMFIKQLFQRVFPALLALFILLSCTNGNQPGAAAGKPMGEDDVFDVVIVGGGAAGLAAAYGLRERRVLLLEKNDYLGGRILTREQMGVTYEMGALFAYDPRDLPFQMQSTSHSGGRRPVGIWLNGQGHFAQSIAEAALKLPELPQADKDRLSATGKGPAARLSEFSDAAQRIIEALFNVIHAGRMADYADYRHSDAFITFPDVRVTAGNRELVEAFRSRISADVRMSTMVTALRDTGDEVQVDYVQGGKTHKLKARAAVVATPADVAARLLPQAPARTHDFLKSIRYENGAVVLLALRNMNIPDFHYIVTPDAAMNSIFHRISDNDRQVDILTVYYAAEKLTALGAIDKDTLVSKSLAALVEMGLAKADQQDLVFSDAEIWRELGHRIEEAAYGNWSIEALRPSPRIVLAGDYAGWGGDRMPYGLSAAIRSGTAAAGTLRAFLAGNTGATDGGDGSENTPESGAYPALTSCAVYRLAQDQPYFEGMWNEGNVAFYGYRLMLEPDATMVEYLRTKSKNNLWEYHDGFGVTSADSAIVIEGLWRAGLPPAELTPSLDALVEKYFDEQSGGFVVVPQGRAVYWRGPSLETTAHVAWLLQTLAPARHAEAIRRAADFVRRSRNSDGLWTGKWFPAPMLAVYQAVRFLAALKNPADREILQQAAAAIVARQRQNGSWSDLVIDSAAAIMALQTLGGHDEAVRRGRDWLNSQRTAGRINGEPVLYYWFDDPQARRFFSCSDKGEVSGWWVDMALRAAASVSER